MKTCPLNVKKFDHPPTKKVKVVKQAPEFLVAQNVAPTPGGPLVQRMRVVS